jgi:hypothetical protein
MIGTRAAAEAAGETKTMRRQPGSRSAAAGAAGAAALAPMQTEQQQQQQQQQQMQQRRQKALTGAVWCWAEAAVIYVGCRCNLGVSA